MSIFKFISDRNRITRSLFALLIICVIISGCEEGTTDAPPDPTFEIQPLISGSNYYYRDSTIIFDGWRIDSTRMVVAGKTTLTGEPNSQGVAMWDVYTDGDFIKRYLINLEQDGLYHYAEINNDDTLFLEKLWVKYPVDSGDQFLEPKYTYIPQTGEYRFDGTWKWHCISIDSLVTIKNGKTLICHVFRAVPSAGTEVFLMYSLNIGYTGQQVNENGEVVFRQIMTDYYIPSN